MLSKFSQEFKLLNRQELKNKALKIVKKVVKTF